MLSIFPEVSRHPGSERICWLLIPTSRDCRFSRFIGTACRAIIFTELTFRRNQTQLLASIGEFVRKLRIEHACAELMKGDLPLATIALQAGFVDQSHFSKVFKLYVGMTPHKYRNIVRSS